MKSFYLYFQAFHLNLIFFSNTFVYFLGFTVDSSVMFSSHTYNNVHAKKKAKRKVQGVPQSQAEAHPRHQEEEERDKTKQTQFEQTYEKH